MAAPDYELLSLDDIHDLLIAGYQNRFPADDVSRLSDNWKRLRVTAMAVTDMQANTNQKAKDIGLDTAKKAALDRHLSNYGLERSGATVARGTGVGRVQGTSGSPFGTTDLLEHANGLDYRPNAAGTVPAAGFIDIDIVSVDTGSQTKLDSGEILTWKTTPTGIENEVELQGDIDQGGNDTELDGPAQSKLLNRVGQPAAGGNTNDYHDFVLDATDSAGDDLNFVFAFSWPNRDGLGSVDVGALFDGQGSARLPTAGQLTDLSTHIETLRPTALGVVRVVTIAVEAQDIDITITPLAGEQWAKDWDDSAGFTVSSWTAATRLLVLSANRPDSLAPGDRLTVVGHDGDQLVVESLGANPDEVVIRSTTFADAAIYTPIAAETIYAGGPLVEPVRLVIIAHMNQLGPREGDFSDGTWESTLYVNTLTSLADAVEGVKTESLTTPAADASPTAQPFPNLDTVNVFSVSEVLVRYA